MAECVSEIGIKLYIKNTPQLLYDKIFVDQCY